MAQRPKRSAVISKVFNISCPAGLTPTGTILCFPLNYIDTNLYCHVISFFVVTFYAQITTTASPPALPCRDLGFPRKKTATRF